MLLLSIAQSVLVITFFTGYWEFFRPSFKWAYTLTLTAIILGLFIHGTDGSSTTWTGAAPVLLGLVQLYLLYQLAKILITIFERKEGSLEIGYPLKNGMYMITDGGNSKISRLMNYHYYSRSHKRNKTNNSMIHATDMVKIGQGKGGFLPTRNEDYPSYNERLYSPMDGTVAKIVDGIPDNRPFAGNYPYNAGNTIVIRNGDLYFLLGHLKCDSFQVKEGDTVEKGQHIAHVGNSGWTERPHLHMQLIRSGDEDYWHGMGVPITYRNRNLYKNRMVDMRGA